MGAILSSMKQVLLREDFPTSVQDFHYKYWYFVGLLEPVKCKLHRFFHFYPRVGLLSLAYGSLLYIVSICTSKDTVVVARQCFQLGMNVMAIVKCSTYLFQRGRINRLSHKLTVLHETHLQGRLGQDTRIMHLGVFMRGVSTFMCKVLPITCYISLCPMMAILTHFSYKRRLLIFRDVVECDLSSDSCYLHSLFQDFIMGTWAIQLIGHSDVYLADFLFQVVTQMKILNYNLENIHEYASKSVEEKSLCEEAVSKHSLALTLVGEKAQSRSLDRQGYPYRTRGLRGSEQLRVDDVENQKEAQEGSRNGQGHLYKNKNDLERKRHQTLRVYKVSERPNKNSKPVEIMTTGSRIKKMKRRGPQDVVKRFSKSDERNVEQLASRKMMSRLKRDRLHTLMDLRLTECVLHHTNLIKERPLRKLCTAANGLIVQRASRDPWESSSQELRSPSSSGRLGLSRCPWRLAGL